jgi:hypothetical protein
LPTPAAHRPRTNAAAKMYKQHTCIIERIERNNHGHTVIAYAKEDSSIRLYRTREVDKITNKVGEKIGWDTTDTTEKSKKIAIDMLARDFEDAKCVPHSAETYAELRMYVHGERGKMAGLPGKNDDRVMGLSLANITANQNAVGSITF